MTPDNEKSLGDQELELLRWITLHDPVTVGEATEQFGVPLGLSRSTVVTVMERLRKKGYLTRKKQEGVFQYSSPVGQETLLSGLVQRFVEKTLAGSLSPLVAYFASARNLTPEERAQLESLILRLDEEKTQDDEEHGQ